MIGSPDISGLDSHTQFDLSILQISDLHFGVPFIEEIAEAALQSAQRLAPDILVVSGDLTQRARQEQFEAARDYLARFPDIPRLVIPGNHDIPLYHITRRLFDPHRLYREIISQDLNPVLQLDKAVLVGIDSTAPRSAISNGRIHNWQLDHAAEVFAGLPPETARIIVAHHHFAPAPDYLRDTTMQKAKRAMARFEEIGVDLILGGHLHRAYIGNSLDFYPGKDRTKGIIIVQSGTTTSRRGRGREREKNSFNLIQFNQNRIRVKHFLFFDEKHGFIEHSWHEFRRVVA
jgi:3',5'-cyclic AMP phosphodiesterase CpdA